MDTELKGFERLTSLRLVRNTKEAIYFYGIMLVLTVLAGGAVGAVVAGLSISQNPIEMSAQIGAGIAIFVSVVLSAKIVKDRGFSRQTGPVLLVAASGALALVGGALLGLIPVAILTMKSPAVADATSEAQQPVADASEEAQTVVSTDESTDESTAESEG